LVLVSEKENSLQLIGFRAGGKLYGVNILAIREILRKVPLEPIQNAPPFVVGGIRIRGTVIPAVDLKRRLGKPDPSDTYNQNWVLIANAGNGDVGFLVDSVTRILKVEPDDILPAPDLILAGLRSPYVQGVCNSEVGMHVVLDLNRILVADEIKALQKMEAHQPA
jgi:purine-binding chemotaxis protein CheW